MEKRVRMLRRAPLIGVAFLVLGGMAVAGGMQAYGWAEAQYRTWVGELAQQAVMRVGYVWSDAQEGVGEQGLLAASLASLASLDGSVDQTHGKAGQAQAIAGCYTYWGSDTCPSGQLMYPGWLLYQQSSPSYHGKSVVCWDNRLWPWDGGGDADNNNFMVYTRHEQHHTGKYSGHMSNWGGAWNNHGKCVQCCGP